jgi:hypothetical protein
VPLPPPLLLLLLLLLLQSCHMACDLVDEKGVYLTTGNPLPSDIESVVNWLLNEDFTTAFQSEWCCRVLRVFSETADAGECAVCQVVSGSARGCFDWCRYFSTAASNAPAYCSCIVRSSSSQLPLARCVERGRTLILT